MVETTNKLTILSFGAGAIGTYIGGSLAACGHRVVFIEQPAVLEKLKKGGMHLDLSIDPRRSDNAEISLSSPHVEFVPSFSEALAFGPFDVALFALKSFDTETVLASLGTDLSKLPPILCLQNGVANEDLIAKYVGADKVIYGTVTSAIGRRDAGSIVLEKLRGVGVALGHPLSARLVAAMDEAMLNARTFNEPRSMKWSKMLTNLLANATSAILNMTPSQVFADPSLAKLEIGQIKECLAVMRSQGIRVVDLPGTPVKALAFAMNLPLWLSQPFLVKAIGGGRGAKMPSFHIDLYSGRKKSEVDFLNGAVSNVGMKAGVPTPINTLLSKLLIGLTDGSIPLDSYDHAPKKLLEQLKG